MEYFYIFVLILIAVLLIWVSIPKRKGSLPDKSERAKLDARRFAKLLVAEIRLYNPHEVEMGKQNNDIYERLTKEIERAKKIYESRVGKDNGELSEYFYEELLNTLAEGDPKKLGSDYSKTH